jgi:uncharacterized damage-inducible protein DinB
MLPTKMFLLDRGRATVKFICNALIVIVAASVITLGAYAQNTPKSDPAPKPPLNSTQSLLEAWNDIGRKLIAMAEDFPEDKYDFKPNPTQRSFAEQLLHAAEGNYFFINPVKGLKPPEGDLKRSDFKTKAAVVEYLRKSFAEGAALIQAKGDSGLNDLFVPPFADRKARVGEGAWSLIEHSGEHYGQLVVYYRVAGLVPPESRPKK